MMTDVFLIIVLSIMSLYLIYKIIGLTIKFIFGEDNNEKFNHNSNCGRVIYTLPHINNSPPEEQNKNLNYLSKHKFIK